MLAFDLVVGILTYGRILGTSYEDYLAVRGMARIRHGYSEIAPSVLPYQLTTSAGMTGLILAMLGGVLGFVVALVLEWSVPVAFGAGAVAAFGLFVALGAITVRFYLRIQARLQVMFPTPGG